jgi:hypothetical protein
MNNSKVLVLLAVAAMLAGCGNGDQEAPGEAAMAEGDAEREPWDKDAYAGCELVSDDDVRTALGEAIDSKEEGGFYGCRWKTESYTVGLRAFPDTSLPAGSCDEAQTGMPYGQSAQGRTESVTGLGDAAVWGTSGNLLVCTGRGLLVVDLEDSGSMTQDAQKQAASAIAGSALRRLEPDR